MCCQWTKYQLLKLFLIFILECLECVFISYQLHHFRREQLLLRVELRSSLTCGEQFRVEHCLIIWDKLRLVSESMISDSLICFLGDSTIFNHVGEHGCDLLARLIGSESIGQLQFLVHVVHLSECFIVLLSIVCFCKPIDLLIELVACGHWQHVALVVLGTEHTQVVVTRLIFGMNIVHMVLWGIPDSLGCAWLMLSLKDSSLQLRCLVSTLLLLLVLLVDCEL